MEFVMAYTEHIKQGTVIWNYMPKRKEVCTMAKRGAYDKKVKVGADALQVDTMKVIPIIFVPLLIILFIFWHITGKRRKRLNISKYTIYDLPKKP